MTVGKTSLGWWALFALAGLAVAAAHVLPSEGRATGALQYAAVTKARPPVPNVSATLFKELVTNQGEGNVRALIQTNTRDVYAAVSDAVEQAGGSVTRLYKYATGMAAEIPKSAILGISRIDGVVKVSMDEVQHIGAGAADTQAMGGVIPLGSNLEVIDASMRHGVAVPLEDTGYGVVSLDGLNIPDIYQNVVAMNAALVWDTGNFGQDSLAVIIDTGIYDQHFMLAGGVVGGIDISTDVGTAFEGFNLATNHWHGTHVSGTLAGHGAIIIPNDDLLTQSIELYSGTPLPAYDANNKILPLLGMAPAAQLYGIKVFPHTGAGTSTSTIIAAIEHAIDLKVSGTLDVDVINMSLGGANLFDGRDLEDQVIDMATFYDITVVVAASNDGPTSMTIQSPGTANTAVTVGATADPVQVRTFWDQNFGLLGIGQFLFVDDNTQIVYFSSRGPTADGRDKPTASANGSFVLSSFNTAAAPQSIAFSSGTSMATPGMAGVAALLNTYGESMGASPYDYKQAIISGSLPVPGFDKYDQGAGVVNAAAAMAALQADAELGSVHPDLSNDYSANSVKPKGTLIQGLNGKNGRTIQVSGLPPGYQQHYYFHVHPNTEQITIDFTNVDLGADPFGLNSFEVYLQSSTRSLNNSYLDTTNVWGDASFVIGNLSTTADGAAFGVVTQDLPLMPGEMRLVIENDWTSFDAISATVNINQVSGNESDKPDESYSGTLNTGESDGFFPVGFGPGGVELSLSWDGDWSRYPTSDMDLIVAWFDTGGNLSFEFAAATLNSNEMMRIESGDVGAVFVLVDGFDTNGVDENWDLAVQHLN